MSKWWSQDSCPGLWDFKARGLNPLQLASLCCGLDRPLCSPGRRAVVSRPEVPQTFQHTLPLCPLTSVYHFPALERLGPCLLPCRNSDVRKDGIQYLASEHLNWQSKDSLVNTHVCFVGLQYGICQRQGLAKATQVFAGFLSWPAR